MTSFSRSCGVRAVLAAIVSLLASTIWSEGAIAAPLVLGPGDSHLTARAEAFACCPSGGDTDTLRPASFPFSDSHQVAIRTETNTTAYHLDGNGFDITFDHSRGSRSSTASTGRIYFTAAEDAVFRAIGVYVIEGDRRGRVLGTTIHDITAGAPILEVREEGSHVPLAYDSIVTIEQGHWYRFSYQAGFGNNEAGETGGTGIGSIRFRVVPEPSTALLVSLGLSGIALRRKAGDS